MNERLSQKTTPKFWRKVRNAAIIIGAIGGAVLSAGAGLPAAVITIATVLTSAATAVAGAAALTKEDVQPDK